MAMNAASRPYVQSFVLDDGEQQLVGGSAVWFAEPSCGGDEAADSEPEDFGWSLAQTEAFLAGEPLTLRFSTRAPQRGTSQRVYVCCWVTLDSQ
jgi:hypothetical protein